MMIFGKTGRAISGGVPLGRRALQVLIAVVLAAAAPGTLLTVAVADEIREATGSKGRSGKTGRITLAWNPVPGAAWYNLYYSTRPGVTRGHSRKIGRITSTTHTVHGLKPGTTYYFVVTAATSGIESPASEEVSGKPKRAKGDKKNGD